MSFLQQCFVLVLACLCISFISAEMNPKYTQIDLIIQGLEEQKWEKDETKCITDTLNVFNNVKNHTLWALWIWNSMQHPTGTFYGSRYSLGNYDQCIKVPSGSMNPQILTQYCLVDIKLTDDAGEKGNTNPFSGSDQFLRVRSKVGRNFNLITWGACLPASCNPHSVTKIMKSIYSVNPLASAVPQITVDSCQVAGETKEFGFQFYLFMAILLFLIIIAVLSSYYFQYCTEDSTITKIVYSFNLKRNWSSFTRRSEDEIPVLSFTKTVHLIATTCSHSFVFALFGAMSNATDFDNAVNVKENMVGNLMAHIDLPTVENFFVISGLLVMKSLMEGKRKPIISLVQRYVRLIGSLTVLVFFTTSVFKYTGDGPLWNKLAGREVNVCERNWLWSLLMINNYVDDGGICQFVAWYVPCDYQLAVMGTVLYCIWQWNRKVGKITIILATVLALVLPGVVTYWNRYPGMLFFDLEHMVDVRNNVVFQEIYIKSHNRAAPYLLGMATGYILTMYRPAKYRRVISRTWCYIGYAIAIIMAIRVWTSAGAWCLLEYDAWNSALYAALNRNIWAIATCMCILISSYGNVPEIQTIIAWPGFVIGSRLAYGVYITHSIIIQRNIFSQRNPMQYDMFDLIVNGLGVFVAASVFAVLLWLFAEAPLSNLTNLILVPTPRKQAVNGIQNKQAMDDHTVIHEFKDKKSA